MCCNPHRLCPQMEDDSIYNMSQSRGYPVPPPLPMACNAEPSELYQVRISITIIYTNASEKPVFLNLANKHNFKIHVVIASPAGLKAQSLPTHPPVQFLDTCSSL